MIHLLWISQTNWIKRNQIYSTRCLSAWQRAPITPFNSCRQRAVSGGMSLDRSASFCLFLSVPRSHRGIPHLKSFIEDENTNCISGIHFHVEWSENNSGKPWVVHILHDAHTCTYSKGCWALSSRQHTHTHTHTHCTRNLRSWVHAVRDVCLLTFDPCTTPHNALPASEASLQHWPKSRWNHPLASGFGQMSQDVIWMLQCSPILSSV